MPVFDGDSLFGVACMDVNVISDPSCLEDMPGWDEFEREINRLSQKCGSQTRPDVDQLRAEASQANVEQGGDFFAVSCSAPIAASPRVTSYTLKLNPMKRYSWSSICTQPADVAAKAAEGISCSTAAELTIDLGVGGYQGDDGNGDGDGDGAGGSVLGVKLGPVIGGAVGGIVFLVVIGLAIWYCVKEKGQRRASPKAAAPHVPAACSTATEAVHPSPQVQMAPPPVVMATAVAMPVAAQTTYPQAIPTGLPVTPV